MISVEDWRQIRRLHRTEQHAGSGDREEAGMSIPGAAAYQAGAVAVRPRGQSGNRQSQRAPDRLPKETYRQVLEEMAQLSPIVQTLPPTAARRVKGTLRYHGTDARRMGRCCGCAPWPASASTCASASGRPSSSPPHRPRPGRRARRRPRRRTRPGHRPSTCVGPQALYDVLSIEYSSTAGLSEIRSRKTRSMNTYRGLSTTFRSSGRPLLVVAAVSSMALSSLAFPIYSASVVNSPPSIPSALSLPSGSVVKGSELVICPAG